MPPALFSAGVAGSGEAQQRISGVYLVDPVSKQRFGRFPGGRGRGDVLENRPGARARRTARARSALSPRSQPASRAFTCISRTRRPSPTCRSHPDRRRLGPTHRHLGRGYQLELRESRLDRFRAVFRLAAQQPALPPGAQGGREILAQQVERGGGPDEVAGDDLAGGRAAEGIQAGERVVEMQPRE